MSETNDTQEEQKNLTPEEIKAIRARAFKYYKEEIQLLKIEAQYHDLKAQVEEGKLRELTAIAQYAQIMNPVNQQQERPEIGDDGFPVDWEDEQKAEYLKAHPEYQEELTRLKEAQAKDAAKADADKHELEPEDETSSEEKPKRKLANS